MVNGKELHLKIRFKYVTPPLPRRSVDSDLWSVASNGAANSLQLLWPLVRRTVIASYRQKISPFGSVGQGDLN
jgi:hypothetical protein